MGLCGHVMGMDNIDVLLRAAAQQVPVTPHVMAAFDEVGERFLRSAGGAAGSALTDEERGAVVGARRRRRRRLLLTGAVGLALAGVASPAAANFVGLHTGIFGTDGSRHGEFLNLASPEGVRVLRRFEEQYPLPSGGTWSVVEGRFGKAPAGVGQEGVFEAAVAGESQCQWTKAWLSATAAGNAASTAGSLTVLGQIPRWHWVTTYQDSTHGLSTLAQAIADAARAGDPRPARQFVQANCSDVSPARG